MYGFKTCLFDETSTTCLLSATQQLTRTKQTEGSALLVGRCAWLRRSHPDSFFATALSELRAFHIASPQPQPHAHPTQSLRTDCREAVLSTSPRFVTPDDLFTPRGT